MENNLIPELLKNIVAMIIIVGAMYFTFGRIDDDNDDNLKGT